MTSIAKENLIDIPFIESEIAKLQIEIFNLARHKNQGFMSQVFVMNSSKGELILHIVSPNKEQQRQKVDEKMEVLANFLKEYPQILTAKIVLRGNLPGGRFFIVQEKLKGENLGERKIVEGKILDEYFFQNVEGFLEQINQAIYQLHKIPVEGYGWIRSFNNEPTGMYASWKEFLWEESQVWLDSVFPDQEEWEKIRGKIEKLFEENVRIFQFDESVLIHGDIINPGNILVKGGSLSGIVDFEWALSGDPAWEFAFKGDSYLDHYFKICRDNGIIHNEEEFRKRVEIYGVFWLLWGTHVHAQGGELKEILLKDFQKKLKQLTE